jgi:hypothetical protein
MARKAWAPIIDAARLIVFGYTYLITLRQLHYRLVMSPGLGYDNTEQDYKRLSALTAQGRRDGSFPSLLDQTREIVTQPHWASPAAYIMAESFMRDRTAGQDWLIVLGGEKATLLAQLQNWYSDFHFPIVLLRGYGSQTYVDDVSQFALHDGRKAVLIYAGDHDPSGEDILRDFTERCPHFDAVEHIAILPGQIAQFGLPMNPGTATDSRAGRFIATHGYLGQVEVEALPPDDLQALYQAQIDAYWDETLYQNVLDQEKSDKALLREVQSALEDGKLYLDADGKLRKRR